MDKKSNKNQRRIPRQARALAKYDAVLDACTQVLASCGYQKATVMELSLESGVAVPTIYQYFENKDEIFIAWIHRVIDQVLSAVSTMKINMPQTSISTYIDTLMPGGLMAINHYRKSIHELITSTSNTLSAEVVRTMEEKTLAMLYNLFADEIASAEGDDTDFRLQVLVRMILGYLLSSVLNESRAIHVDREAVTLSRMTRLYLHDIGIDTSL